MYLILGSWGGGVRNTFAFLFFFLAFQKKTLEPGKLDLTWWSTDWEGGAPGLQIVVASYFLRVYDGGEQEQQQEA
jgi:hypothetical protein